MEITVRPVTADEYVAAFNAKAVALLQALTDEERFGDIRPRWEKSRTLAAWDGDTCVGTAGQFEVDTLVPGGARVATAAVTRVGVLPTYRRRGIATELLTGLVDDAVQHSLVMMSLRASETSIYGRFGFGIGGELASIELDPAAARPIRGAAPGSFRLVRPDEAVATVDDLYPRVALRRPGAITRPGPSPSLNEIYLENVVKTAKAEHVVIHLDADGRADGYAHYGVHWTGESPVGSTGVGRVFDVFGATDAAELALWDYLTKLDLVRVWHAGERPVDDLVRNACRDPRAYRVTLIEDEQWLRLVDVDAALSARTYRPATVEVTIAVEDPLVEANNAIWTISAAGARQVMGSAAGKTVDGDVDVDISAPIAALSAAYLGGRRWTDLVALGQATSHHDDACWRADCLFGVDRLPFCGTFF